MLHPLVLGVTEQWFFPPSFGVSFSPQERVGGPGSHSTKFQEQNKLTLGSVLGAYLLTGIPSLLMRNLVKFHLMALKYGQITHVKQDQCKVKVVLSLHGGITHCHLDLISA
jgi:hypothetical protein